MGLEGDGDGFPDLSSASKHKYKMMDLELSEDDDPSHHHHRQKSKSTNTPKYVIACATFASLNTALIGYDLGVMSGALLFIVEDLKITEMQEGVLVGCLSIISLLGSLAGGRTSDAIGRKWTMALAAIVFQTGVCIMALANSFKVLMIGRLLTGVGVGFGGMIAPIYIAEISPTTARGFLTSFPEIFVNVGILLGFTSNYAFSDLPAHLSWRVMLGAGIIPCIFMGFALFIIPESPRWLVMQNRVEEARSVLMKTNENEKEVEERLEEIQQSAAGGISSSCKYEEKAVWRELLAPSPSIRRMLITGFGIQCFQQLVGIDTTLYYCPTIFREAGIQDNSTLLAVTVLVGVIKTALVLVATFLIDEVGRKPLMYISSGGMTVCLFSLGLTLSLVRHGHAAIILAILSVCGYVSFFSIGMGPVGWVLTSEIFPLRLRAQAVALGAVGNRVSSGLISMSFLSGSRAITVAGIFFIFSLISALSIAFVYAFVPETKGKSLEQIELLFEDGGALKGCELELADVEHLVPKQ